MASNNLDIMKATDFRPNYVAQPDGRFATAFLSNDLRDFAVDGEALMDKSSGELFLRRPADGRVVSFFQNKKYMDELMFEMRVLINNNPDFTYPSEDKIEAIMTSTNYDMLTINDNKVENILLSNTTIKGDAGGQPYHYIKFRLSGDSNGFFIRLSSRDCDKPLINYLTQIYNVIVPNYVGDHEDFLNEQSKFYSYQDWFNSNAVIDYELTAVREDGTSEVVNYSAFVNINENSCVILPEEFRNTLTSEYLWYEISIKDIRYDKVHFIYQHQGYFKDEVGAEISRFIYPDNRVCINYINVVNFVRKSTDIVLNDNEFVVAIIDVPQCHRIMQKMSKLLLPPTNILSEKRPSDGTWVTNATWSERIRDVHEDGVITVNNTPNNFNDLEMFLASNASMDDTEITINRLDYRNYLVRDGYGFPDEEEDPDKVISTGFKALVANEEGDLQLINLDGTPSFGMINYFKEVEDASNESTLSVAEPDLSGIEIGEEEDNTHEVDEI